MSQRPVLFLDDAGVMSDSARRERRYQRLVGEFFAPRLGGTPEAWSAANGVVFGRLTDEYLRTMRGRTDIDYAAYSHAYALAWLRGMCELVGVPAPPEEECRDLEQQATVFIAPRSQEALPGASEAIRDFSRRGYVLHTASGERSLELDGYLAAMGVRPSFGHLYGPDLVGTLKEGPYYYRRIFAHAGVKPQDAVVVDDIPITMGWIAAAGARGVLVDAGSRAETPAVLVVRSLSELPDVIARLER